jgi:uncharacterized membrane protein (UPF0127 family)
MAAFTLDRIEVADRPLARMRGLLGRDGIAEGEGLLLRPAGSIHTFFMRFSIDAVFLDKDLVVLGTSEHLLPWSTAGRPGAKAVLEVAAGTCERLRVKRGDRLVLSPGARRALATIAE